MANPMEIYKRAKAGNITPLIKKETSVSSDLNWIIMKALAPDLSKRYKKVEEIITDLNNLLHKKKDSSSELKSIKVRIDARTKRTDYICWNCHKTMPRKMSKCLYCGTEQ